MLRFEFEAQPLARHPKLRSLADPEQAEQRDLASYQDLPLVTRRVFYALLITNLVLMVVFIIRPVAIIGAPAILLLALGLITVVGSALVYTANHYQVPILTLLVVWAAFCSVFNDNHAVRANAGMSSHGFLSRASVPPLESLAQSPRKAAAFVQRTGRPRCSPLSRTGPRKPRDPSRATCSRSVVSPAVRSAEPLIPPSSRDGSRIRTPTRCEPRDAGDRVHARHGRG